MRRFIVARYWRAFCIALFVAASGARAELVFYADPACPGKTDAITVTAYTGAGSGNDIQPVPQAVERANELIHIVGVDHPGFNEFPSYLQIDLGTLPIGTYRIELALRVGNPNGTLGPE